ncbi:CCR4-NOT transcription complex subunit 1 [Heracleum sosnowskyi]|uniref:CCR4-NOT transcription complex subunit 1 n=1 Tax=Heracleum sosnowskyi TaxID=360622 RepID=A0AAD8HED9_9APIA|nr:CCR4-NOT transcription complex subunit 1 [Heracleum sosnowskyi]
MLPFSVTASNHIRYLLDNVTDANFDSVYQQLSEFIGYGTEESILVLQTCFDQLNIQWKDYKNIQLEPIFVSIFRNILNRPNFSTLLCQSIKSPSVNEDLLDSLCKAMQLAAPERIVLGLALSESENPDVRMCGKSFCMTQISQLCSNHEKLDSAEQIQNILIFLNQSEGLCKHVDSFMEILSLVHLKEDSEFILAPLLTDELREVNFFSNMDMFNENSENEFDTILAEMEKELCMADLMKEFGYGCTVNVTQCKEMLSLFLPLSEATVARIFSTVVRTNSGLDSYQNTYLTFCSAISSSSLSDFPHLDSWSVDVLIESITQLAPGINWINVFENLDHEGFYIPNEASFTVLMSIYRHACQEPFPLHAVCGSVWKNAEGQISFLKHAVSVPPEVFSFANAERQLAFTDAVKGVKFNLEHANHAWKSLDLLEVLCQLAERGHAGSVRPMLEYPRKHCPEILLLGVASITTTYNLLQYEVYSAVFPELLKNSTGASLFLHLWHVNNSLLLRGFIDAFSIDPDNMIKVLDLCHELKILTKVLEMVPFSFGIRMAVLGSRKELVDLETWLSTNLSTYKDTFFEECLKFIKEVQISTQEKAPSCFNQSTSLWSNYSETVPAFLKVLQANGSFISSSNLFEEIEKMNLTVIHSNVIGNNPSGTDSSTVDGYADDVEAEINSLFHQMFSGQVGVDATILMLTRYKESSEKREQSIFECMIANLFEEYKFFSKYPDRQLNIAAVLFGSLIKDQLVTHLTLGIALRAVLDALRKPADSKMFMFGTKALEQFVDRLAEWPQYCNHILQISHLRGTHSELVALIDRTLVKISSSHSELDGGHVTAVDQHKSSIPAANVETQGSAFPFTGSTSVQIGSQVSSTVQLQQRQQSLLEEQHKASLPLASYMKPTLSAAMNPPVPTTDTSSTLKSTADLSTALSSSTALVRPSRAAPATRFGSALSIETLVAAAEQRETLIQAPASEIQDKISFIINNLSPANVEAKAKEFSEFFKEQYYPWFARYLVMKRASIEPNFHDLYLKFLDKVNSKPLNKEIVQATYENCKVLLGSELIKSSSEERSLLKNLGSWLGKITIGRNQVLRAREIDPKTLIIEAYEKGWMIGVVPFTSRILESCQNSLAYQPPNPWTMGILALLTEIYAMPNLKMNLKFDIEVLFKNLSVDMKDVTPSSLLKDRAKEIEGNTDFSNKDVATSQTSIVSDVKPGIVSTLNQVEVPHDVASSSHTTVSSHISSQLAAPVHLSSSTSEDEKVAPLVISDQLPSAQGILQVQSSFSVSQLPAPASSIELQVVVNPKLHSLGLQRHFQSVLPPIMDRSIKEIVSGIVQRSVSIATQTTKELVLKDYCMESDENRIRNAAHLMVASLSGSLAHVTCKEPLRASIIGNLRTSVQGLTLANELLEQAVQLATNDNLDLGCALIEQAATEKAVQTIDGEIAQQLSIRRKQREGVGPAFFDTSLYTHGHMGVLPESLRPKPGRLSHSQQRVYEDFVRLPWQNQSSQTSNPLVGPPTSVSVGFSEGYGSASGQLNSGLYLSVGNTGMGAVADSTDLGPKALDAGPAKQLSVSTMHSVLAEGVDQQNFEKGTIPASASELPVVHTNAVKESGEYAQGLSFTSTTERFGREPSTTTGDELDKFQLVSEKLAGRPGSPESLRQLVEIARNPAALSDPTVGKEDNLRHSRDRKQATGHSAASREEYNLLDSVEPDPVGFRDQVSMLFAEWYRICELPGPKDAASARYVLQLMQSGLLKGDDMSDRFFRLLMELSVSHCLQLNQQTQPLSFLAIDIYAALVFSILKFCPVDQGSSKLSLLSKVLAVAVRIIYKDAEEKNSSFNPRPYFRLFINWLLDLTTLEPVSDGANLQVLIALANAFHALQPLKVPAFSYAWLELVSHKCFMPKLLTGNPQKGWPCFHRLLVDLFQFLEPFLRNAELGEPVHFLYRGSLRVLLVLLHDFPEFLCDYHFSFCDVIPPSCIQMRNIVLSAFPRNMRLPDPSTPNLKIDLLAEITQSPRILSEVDAALKAKQMKSDVDDFLKTKQHGSSFLSELKKKLLLAPVDAGRAGILYNVPLMNSLVLYVGVQAIQQLQARTPAHAHGSGSLAAFHVGSALDIFQLLITELDTEGRYLFLNAVANQLRYPNNHTHYFSFILLYLFAESNQQEVIQEQITRVLLERLIVNRPHPWGLLITFIELIKNPRYNFWSRSFTRCAPEIEKLFESVSRLCGGPKPVEEGVASGGLSDML